MDLAEKLLVLADATATDGGQALVRALRTVLAETAPFDAGEAVLAVDGRLLRWRIDEGPAGEILGADLVRHIGALHAPLRLDDLDDVSPFPETRRAMEALGLRSLLVLPFQGGGALAVARRYGWAFVGASLHHLWPVRGMAGIGLRQAVLLGSLGQKVEALEGELERATATPNELRARLERAETESREREAQRAAATAGWEGTRAELRQTARALAAAEEAARAAEAARERAEAGVAERERRIAEEAGKREAAEAQAERRQAEADEKLGRAEGARRALTVEVEALRRESESAQGRERGSEQERTSLRAALGEQESRGRGLEARVAGLEKTLAEVTDGRDEARSELERSRRAAEAAGRASGESRQEAARVQSELEQVRKGATEEHAQLASLSGERDELRRETEALEARLATEIPALEADNRVLRSELQASRDEATRHLRAAQRAEKRLSALEEREGEGPVAPRPRPKRPRSGR